MSASEEQASPSRPPGGTSRATGLSKGNRTPRKVQWPDEEVDRSSTRSAHMLDEHGLDNDNFKELTDALERHRKGTPLKKVHYYPPQTPPSYSRNLPPTDDASFTQDEPETSQRNSRSFPTSFSEPSIISSRSSSPTLNAPGQYISDDEDAGLPGTKDLKSYSFKKARQLVRAHLHRGSEFWNSRSSLASPEEGHSRRATDLEKDKGRTTGDDDEPVVEGKGILSTLLNLYLQRDRTPSERSSRRSSMESARVSAESGADESSSGLLARPNSRRSPRKLKSPRMPAAFGGIHRPSTARNAGGVIGSLIASTGNLAGAAAPHATGLQPNVKAPGYRLSRYRLETKHPTRPALPRRHSSGLSELGRQSPSEKATPSLSPSEEAAPSIYAGGTKTNASSIFSAYVPSIRSGKSGRRSGYSTPRSGTPYGSDTDDPGYAASPHSKRTKRKKAEVFITRHVARIIQRQEFLMKLTRAMMMFGGPSHRLQSQIMSAARVLDIHLNLLYLPDVVLISFDDDTSGTSHIKLIKQTSALDLGKLKDAFALYWKVIHDKLSVSDASTELDALMRKEPLYNWWQQILIGGMCSAAICTISFGGSFLDAVISFPFGALLVVIQTLGARNILYTYVFEVTVTTLFSFISAALATTHIICYPAVTSSSVVLILPGFLVLTGALELMSRNIIAGSVRLLFAMVYALFLGFGFTIGAEIFELITSHEVYGAQDFDCLLSHQGPWYRQTPTKWWAFLTVPMFSFFLSMRNQAPWNSRQIVLLVAIASAGWTTNYFTGRRYVGQSDIIAAVGAFAVGLISNIYGRVFSGNAFVVMITGILFQLPSGLGSGGLLTYASEQASGSPDSYISGFRTALKLVSVAIGLTIGLGLSLALTYPIQSRKREAGIFSL
ncbi:hypothetical protein D9613_009458 [Agrocybe pediades]|uniref:Pheromone-regulated membrane protein 10 n=1 Tax=Agrocybe pediades TaxID=84607 RepID=A0A8H4R647_9AGAR|nr:hypothetical protein D9613_009458 [Agrocybe pediades]